MASPAHDSQGPRPAPDFRLLIDSAPALIHTSLPDGYLDFFNQAWLDYVGRSLEDLQGWKWTAVIHPDDVEGIVAEWRSSLASGKPFLCEARVRRADGEYRWMLHHKVAIRDEHGKIVKWHGSSIDIQDRKTAEDQLRRNAEEMQRSEFYLAEGQRLGHMGSWVLDPAGFFPYWSHELFHIFGFEPAKEGPSLEQYLAIVHPKDREYMARTIDEMLAEGLGCDIKKRIVRADGQLRHVRCVGVPVVEDGILKRIIGTAMDVTEQEQLTQELQRREAYLTEAQRLSHTGSWAWNVRTGALFWSEEIFRIYGYNPQKTGPTWDQFLERVHPEDRAQIEQRAKIETTRKEWLDSFGDFRIVLPDGTMKHLHSVTHPARDGSGAITEIIGTVMDVTEHVRLTHELQRRGAYLAEAQRLSHTGSFGWRVSSGEIFWSDETFRIFECDLATKPTIEFILSRVPAEDRDLVHETIERASRDGRDFDFEHRLQMPRGAIKHVHVTAHPTRDSSGNLEFVGAITDISEQRTAEALIRRQEAELRQVVDTIPSIVWSALPDGSNSYVNSRTVEYMGISPEKIAGTGWHAITHPEDLERHNAKWLACVASGEPCEDEVRFRRADGQYRWYLQRGIPLRDEVGNIVKWYGVLIDIEDRKKAEDKIREQEAELRQMLDLAPQIIAVYGPSSERLYANRVALDYIGLSLEEWRETSDRGVYFHPDDQKRALDILDRAFSSGSDEEMELRLRKGDGSYRWFLTRCIPLRDEKGQIRRFYSASIDIDDRKRAEERLHRENVALREEVDKASMFEEIVGTSPALRTVLSRISKVAASDSTVLITGETGTGKELVARAIHRRSVRHSRAFVSVNCAAIPRDLIASELFGHEKGAFTGALQRRIGRFELAEGGTIFLDEVGDLPVETQVALLRVLQEREFERVGGNQLMRANVRVIAATNRDLEVAIGAGSFRRDLFYRLNVFPIESPSLRGRKEDIPMLVEYFIDRYARSAGKRIRNVEKSTIQLLSEYSWPGNIRELQNVVERSVILCEGETLSVDPSWFSLESAQAQQKSQPFGKKSAAQERDMIEAALAKTGGRVSGPAGAAAALEIPASTLESKIRSLGIDKFRFKHASH